MTTPLRIFLTNFSKCCTIFCVVILMATTVTAQESFLGEIKVFAGNFEPRGWAFCDGRLLNVNEYNTLFSVLGTVYGGDGRTTFALPDLRGRVPIQQGQGPGLSNRRLGLKYGSENGAASTSGPATSVAGPLRVGNGNSVSTNMQPSLVMNYIICVRSGPGYDGVFPSRN